MKPWAKVAAVQGAACGLMIGVVFLIGVRVWPLHVSAGEPKQPTVAGIVIARRFVVVDAAGKVRAALTDIGPSLDFYDTAGRQRAKLSGDFPRLQFYYVGQKSQGLSIQVSGAAGPPGPELAPHFSLYDTAGQQRASLYLHGGEVGGELPALELRDSAGNPSARLVAGSPIPPESWLELLDRHGRVMWKAP